MEFLEKLKSALVQKNPLYIKVKVIPKSPKNEIVEIMEDQPDNGLAGGTYKIRVAAPATEGKANAELLKFLKKSLGLKEAAIISGQRDRVKLVKLVI